MNALLALWAASVLGAGLFFASGFVSGRTRRRAKDLAEGELAVSVAPAQPAHDTLAQRQVELENLRRDYQHELGLARQTIAALEAQAQNGSHELGQTIYQLKQTQRELEQGKRLIETLRAENADLSKRGRPAEVGSAELTELKAKLHSLSGELGRERALHAETQQRLQRSQNDLGSLEQRANQAHKLSQELNSLKDELASAKAEAKASAERARFVQKQAADGATKVREQARGENATLTTELEQARAQHKSLTTKLEQANAELGRLAEAGRQADSLRRELARHTEFATTSQTELRASRQEQERLERQLAESAQENLALTTRLEKLTHDLALAEDANERFADQQTAQHSALNRAQREQIAGLERDQRELQVRNRMLTDRVSGLERYAEENQALRQERDLLQSQLAALRAAAVVEPSRIQVTSKVESLADRRPQAPARAVSTSSSSGTTRRVEPSEQTLEAHLVNHLNQLVREEPSITAVLSDDNGFPVVGVGPEGIQEGVCVLTSLAQELATRAVDFVDLDRIKQMELVDQGGRALRVRFFTWQDQALALGCLGASHLQPNLHEERVVSDFPTVLLAASSA